MLTAASRWLLAVTFLCLPATVLAEQTHIYEFRDGAINATWEGIGPLGMTKQPTGILLSTQEETGALVTDMQPPFLADAARAVLTTDRPGQLHFVWLFQGDPDQMTNAVPIDFYSEIGKAIPISLTHSPYWHAGDKRIGIVLPPRTTIVLHRIELTRWNVWEKLWSGILSFWIPDTQRPYSINFVWGPQLEFIPSERPTLYDTPPPRALSATYVTYAVLTVLLIILFGCMVWLKFSFTQALRYSALLLAGTWIFFDLRMGGEFLMWAMHDIKTYSSASPEVRVFRDRDHFYDFAEFAKPFVADRSSYIFFAQAPWPYLGNMRYLTYPSIPGNTFSADDTWVVYDRPDVSMDAENRVTMSGVPVSLPGRVLGRFDATSFVFRQSLLVPPAPTE